MFDLNKYCVGCLTIMVLHSLTNSPNEYLNKLTIVSAFLLDSGPPIFLILGLGLLFALGLGLLFAWLLLCFVFLLRRFRLVWGLLHCLVRLLLGLRSRGEGRGVLQNGAVIPRRHSRLSRLQLRSTFLLMAVLSNLGGCLFVNLAIEHGGVVNTIHRHCTRMAYRQSRTEHLPR